MAEVTTESPSVPKNPWGSPHRAQPPPTISTLQLGQAPRTPSHRSRPCPLAHRSQNSHSGPCLQRSPPVTSTSLPGAHSPSASRRPTVLSYVGIWGSELLPTAGLSSAPVGHSAETSGVPSLGLAGPPGCGGSGFQRQHSIQAWETQETHCPGADRQVPSAGAVTPPGL